jgi:alpha-beta hydrolase superfamily lysophospholipase
MQTTDYTVKRPDGYTLNGLGWFKPKSRGTVVIAHGINEHIGRYTHVAECLNDSGFSAVGVDHRGHGRSDAGKARTSNIRRFDTFVDDYIAVIEQVRSEREGPVIALGHSMGGLIAARALLRIQDDLDAAILSGPALKIPTDMSPLMLNLSLGLARVLPFLNAPAGDGDGLSRDPTVHAAFQDDIYCIQQPIKLGIARQIYLLAEETRAQASEVRLPLLVMHGAADRITSPDGSRQFVEEASSQDKEFVLWADDKHEIFNELDREAVLAKLVGWLQTRFPERHQA